MAEQKFDFKKEFKNIYLQKTQPVIVEVPPMTYLCVDGKGNPNTTQEYKDALAILYGLSYTHKNEQNGRNPAGRLFRLCGSPSGRAVVDGKRRRLRRDPYHG